MIERQIIYRQDLVSGRAVLKPDTLRWRLLYWLNQYGAAITAQLIRPIVRWNRAFWRIKENEEYTTMFDIVRIGMRVKEPEPFLLCIRLPFWIRRSKKLLKRAFIYFRDLP